jgi:hypothetical protein
MEDARSIPEQYTDQSLSSVHHALRSSRRRLVVALVAHRKIPSTGLWPNKPTGDLKTHNEAKVSVRQLAKEIVMIEEDVSIDHATGDSYHNVYTSLIQTHLPELDGISAIEYDEDRKRLTADRNLLALSIVAAVSSPIEQMLFHDVVSDMHTERTDEMSDSSSN